MFREHAKLLSLLEQAGEVLGRKKFQKIVYITQKLHFAFNQKFYFHFYGPYSEELTLEIEELHDLGLIEEELVNRGNYHVYRYRITDKGRDFLQHAAVDLGNLLPVLAKLNESSARFLELVSTVLYFEQLSREEVEEKIFTLKAKSNYTVEEINEAYHWIGELRKEVQA